jgi:hypothetical protein
MARVLSRVCLHAALLARIANICFNRIRETTSLRSSILNYHYENGRRYHAYHSGAYWYATHNLDNSLKTEIVNRGPNDERAMMHLDLGQV